MSTPSTEAQPGKDRIPPGTKRIIIFDTNAYRVLTAKTALVDCHAKAALLRQREQAARVFVLTSPTVIWELVAHLADTTDPGFEHCLNSLVVLGEHAVDPNNPQGGVQMFPDADSTVCRELFHAIPPDHEKGNQNLGSFVKHIVKYAPDLSDPRAQANIKRIASVVASTEQQWLSEMQALVSHCDPETAKLFFKERTTKKVRKSVREFFGSSTFKNLWAKSMVQSHAKKVGYSIADEAELKTKAKVMVDVFSVPFQLMSELLQKVASDPSFKIDSTKRKRWNFIWDSQLALSVGADHTIGGVPVFFVTGDKELTEAAEAAGCKNRVMNLDDYLVSVGASTI